jgi:ribose/xylose/arabinose/galactoside ABC-type transport system permease subunit
MSESQTTDSEHPRTAPGQVAPSPARRRHGSDAPLYVILAGIVVLMSVLNPERFPTLSNLQSMLSQLPILAFLSLGMMVSMLSGGINLAIVSTANFTGITTALTLRALTASDSASASLGMVALAMLAGGAACLLVGAFMGWLIAYVEVPAILATLGVTTLLDGINVVLTRGYTISNFPDALLAIGNGRVFGAPTPFLMLVVVVVLLHFLLNRMPFGFRLYMLGSNPIAAKFSNINPRAVLMGDYLLSSCFSALTAFVMMGQLNSVKANYAQSYVLVAVLACFLGGVDPFGGAGRLSGMILAVIILQIIASGVNLLRVDPFFVTAMWGATILVLIAVNHFTGRWREARRLARLQRPGVASDAGSPPRATAE